MSKKIISIILSAGILVSFFTGCSQKQISESKNVAGSIKQEVYTRPEAVISEDAKKLLVDGNKRFMDGNILGKNLTKENLKKLSIGQKPFAVVVACSDSRVVPEIIFDQGLGDIFVIRDAGNVLDKVALGSVEYGAEHLNAPLIVVLGHESCGAVKAAVDKVHVSENIQEIVNKINISIKKVEDRNIPKDKIYKEVEDENIKNSVDEIKNDPIIRELIKQNRVNVIGAKYHLETGEVTF